MQKTSFLLAMLLAVLLSGCNESMMSDVNMEMEMLNPPHPTAILKDVDQYVSLEDTTEIWNPFNHEGHSIQAVIRYQYIYGRETLVTDSMQVNLKGDVTYWGHKLVSATFSNLQETDRPELNANHEYESGEITGTFGVLGYNLTQDTESEFQINYGWRTGKKKGVSFGDDMHIGIRLAYPIVYDVNHFGHFYRGIFGSEESKWQLTEDETWAAVDGKQVEAIMQDFSKLKVTIIVAEGSQWGKRRGEILGNKVFQHLIGKGPYLETLASPAERELYARLTQAPIENHGNDKAPDLVLLQLEFGNPDAATQTTER